MIAAILIIAGFFVVGSIIGSFMGDRDSTDHRGMPDSQGRIQ